VPDDQKKDLPAAPPEPPADSTATSEAPDAAASPSAAPQAEPLADGTVPTVLNKGDGPKHDVPVGDSKRSLNSVYRRADIVTTAITFAIALVIAGLAIGAYAYLTRTKTKTTKPTVTTLDQADLNKLGAFFQGDTAGGAGQVLTINSSSYFKGRTAIGNDLKVEGATSVDGPTQLGDLTVNKTSTLGVTNVRGQLTVSGPLNLQSPATLAAGGSVTGNLTVSGNGSFGGSLSAGLVSVTTLNVLSTLNLSGHLIITGNVPSVSPADGAGNGPTVTIDGNDSAGTVTINTGSYAPSINHAGGLLVNVNFHTAYGKVPHVLITPIGSSSGSLNYYVQKTASGFTVGTSTNPTAATGYTFDYWVVQ
jgi:hypothetical protein